MIGSCSCTERLASTFKTSKKQSAVGSCKICGGMPLVDRKKLPSGSMLSTVGLELTSIINSDLTWKVSKGSRSSSRRARRSISRILQAGTELVNKDLESGDMTISESEKLGVSVLRCRFSGNVEHVPIKKRKFIYKSPSPPPRTPSPHPKDADWFTKSRHDSGRSFLQELLTKCRPATSAASVNDLGQVVDTEFDCDGKNVVRIHEQLDETEDFSGISILAAAACSNSFGEDDGQAEEGSGVEESFVREVPCGILLNNELCSLSNGVSKEDLSSAEISTEGTGSCNSAVPAEEPVASLRTDSSSPNDLPQGNNAEEGQSIKMIPSVDISTKSDGATVRMRESSLRDGRLHWDLNTVMDAWERPFDDQYADSQGNVARGTCEKLQDGNCGDKFSYSEGFDRSIKSNTNKELLCDSTRMAFRTPQLNLEDQKLDAVPVNDITSCSQENLLTSEISCIVKMDSIKEKGSLRCQDGNMPNTGFINVQADTVISSPYASVGKNALVERVACSTTGNIGILKEADDIIEDRSTFYDDRVAYKSINGTETTLALVNGSLDDITGNAVCKSNGLGMIQSSPLCVEMQLSVGGKPVTAMDTEMQCGEVSVQANTETGTQVHSGSDEHPPKSCIACSPSVFSPQDACNNVSYDSVKGTDKVAVEVHSDNGYDTDEHDPLLMKRDELEMDYDSQYEDGEVRESIFHTWEEYDGVDVEVEHADYGSDNAATLGSEGAHMLKNTLEANSLTVGGVGSVNEGAARTSVKFDNKGVARLDNLTRDSDMFARGDNIKKATQSADSRLKMSGWDLLPASCLDSSETATGVTNGSCRKNIGDSNGRTNAKETDIRREHRRESRSGIDGRVPRDVLVRKDRLSVQGSRASEDSDTRYEKDSGSVEFYGGGRYSQHAHTRGRGVHRWVDSPENYRGLKRHHSPSYHGTAVFRHLGPENGAAGRQAINASLHGVHRPYRRSGSPDDRAELDMRTGIGPDREMCPDRQLTIGRGWSVRHDPQSSMRSFRGRVHGPVPGGCSESSFNYPHPSVRRQRSISPIDRRGYPHAHQSYTKSRSRSRTRSPNPGNPSYKHRSKSPSLRSDIRIQRVRSPNQRPGFNSDHMVGFRSIQRRHGSPPRNFRWSDDRKDDVVQFRKRGYDPHLPASSRRSPGRFCLREDKLDFVDSTRNYRSLIPGKFSELDAVDRGRLRYHEEDGDRRKQGYRFGFVSPVRRYDIDGAGKRVRYDVEDDVIGARNSRFRDTPDFHGRSPKDYSGGGTNGRIDDVPRRSREERGTFLYRRDGKYNIDSKSLIMQEADEDATLRRAS